MIRGRVGHLAILRRAGLVSSEASGRHRIYRLRPAALLEVHDWSGRYSEFWRGRLDALGSQRPIATVLVRSEGRIHHFWSSELVFAPADPGQHPRHVDFMWPPWNVLDLTPEGRGSNWHPRLQYG